jgi:type II secretory pathway component PulF
LAIPEIARFFHQFSALLQAGFSVQHSLNLAGNDGSASFQRTLQQVSRAVAAGQDLASAIASHPRYFNAWTTSLIRAAEYSGSLAQTCERLAIAAEHHQRRARLYRSVGLAAMITLVSGLILVTVLTQGINPLIQSSFWLVGLGLMGLLVISLSGFRSLRPDPGLYKLILSLPIVGQLLQIRSMLYFAELELPLRGGVSLLTALDLVRSHIPDPLMARNLAIATQQVRAGQTLSQSLQGRLPALALQMIRTGEETGNLDTAMQKLAEYYEGELERTLHQLQGILRPLSIVAMGGVVALLGIRAIASLINALPG